MAHASGIQPPHTPTPTSARPPAPQTCTDCSNEATVPGRTPSSNSPRGTTPCTADSADVGLMLRTTCATTCFTVPTPTLSLPSICTASSIAAAMPTPDTAGHWMLAPGRPSPTRHRASSSKYALAAE